MDKLRFLKSALVGGASMITLAHPAFAREFNIPNGDLATVLGSYMRQAGVAIVYSDDAVRGHESHGAKGNYTEAAALTQILKGTGFAVQAMPANAIGIVPQSDTATKTDFEHATPFRVAAAAAAGIESVVVTSSKIKGDIQTVPIAITALSQEQLTSRQIAGGPDLVKEVPNLTFSKTNFTGYNIQIRGIGTQAISVTTDPAVAVALNDTAFIRNHFFEQEFYDVSQVEVLRGPQGTLYGRNATAGVVNVVTAKPTDQFEAMLSADIGNYHNRRFEGMVNVPVVDDRLDIRLAGEWTKRDGYSFNELTNSPIDGRDLWSSRLSVGFKPSERFSATLVWEHFQEDDDRLRSSKQLCKADYRSGTDPTGALGGPGYLSQGCLPVSLYSPDAFQVPNGDSLPFVLALKNQGPRIDRPVNVYSDTLQSRDLRVIESTLNPSYKAKNDVIEVNADYDVTPSLTLTSQSAFNHDFLYSAEDYNRYNTTPDVFLNNSGNGYTDTVVVPDGNYRCEADGTLAIGGTEACTAKGEAARATGILCDPQLGCTSRLVAEDLSKEHAWQISQEFRLASNFSGPLNFSFGGNYLHYETFEEYYVFINALTLWAAGCHCDPANPWVGGVSDNSDCLTAGLIYPDLSKPQGVYGCDYIDPNPISSLNGNGHNYFRSANPYTLNSYASFGEVYYNISQDLKLTGGLRWTDDGKHFINIPSEVLVPGWGYPSTGAVNQKWNQLTGRFVANWTPKLDFTDQTLIYSSFSHGYKAGGANPPGAILLTYGGNAGPPQEVTEPIHPLTFKPEFVDAYEVGTKNTLFDGALTLNGDAFFYNYKSYQISEIVDRTSINLNFDATVKGAELESTWEPLRGLKFNFAGGYEDTRVANGSKAIDLMDRTAGVPGWEVSRPFVTQASNCILPAGTPGGSCGIYVIDPTAFNAPNNGEGFDKNLSGNELPNAPHFTTSLSAEYTMPVSENWAATLHSDFYWQSQSFTRIFNDRPYDKLRGYSNVNLALILTSADGWQVLGYLKNVFDTAAITGAFLNSDDTGLTTNVFLTDPRLFGVRVTKNF